MWEATIGLEVHARLLTRTKMFCACPVSFGAPPNTNVCPVCLGYPGALPVLNRAAIELAVRIALATACKIHSPSVFARKNYFYPDLPKGYQISQYDRPLATHGRVADVRISRIHLEEDAGKLLHQADASLVDLNRAGAPLVEIVTEPDITSPSQAVSWLTRLRQILMYCEVSDGNMEEGSLRCDANISVRRPGDALGTRTEIKNLNSFRFIGRAIQHEIERQTAILESGGRIAQETRLYDPAADETRLMRSKEEAHDYRYFPEPDLFDAGIPAEMVEEVRSSIPPLPDERIVRYVRDYGISSGDAEVLVASRAVADFFERTAAESGNPRTAANWVRNEVLRMLNEERIALADYQVTPKMLAALLGLIERGAIGGTTAKEVFEEMSRSGDDPLQIVERKGLMQISDPALIREAAARVLERNAAQATQYRAGTEKVFGYLVGQLMKETGGKANAEVANRVLRELLATDVSS